MVPDVRKQDLRKNASARRDFGFGGKPCKSRGLGVFTGSLLHNNCYRNVMQKRLLLGGEYVYYEKIIIGAGIYGLYAALHSARKGQSVLVLERDPQPFSRSVYINQARIHQGYHYPRSLSTAMKSAGYFERFCRDYAFCINREFDQIYATSSQYSWTSGKQFAEFCRAAGIPCRELVPDLYFRGGMCDGAFLAREYTYDAMLLKDYFLEQLRAYPKNVSLQCGTDIRRMEQLQDMYAVFTADGKEYRSGFVLNAAYAGTNQVLHMAGYEKFGIKYELCEIILCDVNENLRGIGFTVMDGPFFSIMPFGKTGLHSLTAVSFTPHMTSYGELPEFDCQARSGNYCSKLRLGNCNDCPAKPATSYSYMSRLARKYIRDEYSFSLNQTLFSMKPILVSSELDDSRPTVIRTSSQKPVFVSVLSGKINTVYDLDEVLE